MPYPKSLQAYTPAEFYRQPPDEWVRRLDEIAPDIPGVDRLVFRYFEPTEPDGTDRGWQHPDRGQWVLYSAKDIRFIEADRAAQFRTHWSEEATEAERYSLKAVVSDYQHFMWHTRGLYVNPFLILQGAWGGTPAKYTKEEVAFLEGSHCYSEPFPIGSFAACPFDERVVAQIANRNRLLQAANDLAALEAMDAPLAKRHADEAAILKKRETCLDTWKVMIQPTLEYMQSFLRTKEADRVLPRAKAGTARAVGQWKEHWLQHGSIIGAPAAVHKKVQVAVR